MVADELRRQADMFVELEDLASIVARAHNPRTTTAREAPKEQPARETPEEDSSSS
jgi:hypothetical protein